MTAPSWIDQLNAARDGLTVVGAVVRMNAGVTLCPRPPRTWRTFWMRPARHQFVDVSLSFLAFTSVRLQRCERCGYCRLPEDRP